MLEANEESTKILAVLVNSVVLVLDVFLLKKSDHLFLELTGALSWNDLNDRDLLFNRLIDHVIQRLIDLLPFVEYLV